MEKQKELELIREYQKTNDINIRNLLIEENMGWLRKTARSFGNLRILDEDSLIFAGMMYLIKSLDKIDTDRNVKLLTFCTTGIRFAMLDAYKKEYEQLNRFTPTDSDSLSHPRLATRDDRYFRRQASILDEIIRNEEIGEVLESMNNVLEPREWTLINNIGKGCTYKTIAAWNRTTEEQVKNRYQTAITKVRIDMENNANRCTARTA